MKISNLKFVFVLLTVLSLTACDPMQTIVVQNNTDSEVSVLFTFNERTSDFNFSETRDADSLLITLDNTEGNAYRHFDFGMGTWKIQSSLDELIATVNSIAIETPTAKATYEGEEEIREFFTSRISKKYKNVIEIKID